VGKEPQRNSEGRRGQGLRLPHAIDSKRQMPRGLGRESPRGPAAARSTCRTKRFFGFGGQLHEDEVGRRIQAILAGFVDDPEIPFLFGVGIGKNDLNLPLIRF
jgi:hypothetical protein